MYKQLDIFGNEQTVDKRKTYVLHLYHGNNYCGKREIKAHSAKQAKFLFYKEDSRNRQYYVTDCYEI